MLFFARKMPTSFPGHCQREGWPNQAAPDSGREPNGSLWDTARMRRRLERNARESSLSIDLSGVRRYLRVRPCGTGILVLPFLASALFSPTATESQTVSGRLIDNETRRGVVNGTVALLDTMGIAVARVLSGSEGDYVVRAPRPGRYTLRGSGLGYRGGLLPQIEVSEGEEVRLDLYLAPAPIALEPLSITGNRVRQELERQGFWRRRENGTGFHLTPGQLAVRPPVTEAELIGRAPFVYVDRRTRWDGTIPKMRSFGEECVPAVLVDDIPVPVGRPVGIGEPPPTLEEYVTSADITALEVYRGFGEIPHELSLPFESCGVIMIWTVWSEGRNRTRRDD